MSVVELDGGPIGELIEDVVAATDGARLGAGPAPELADDFGDGAGDEFGRSNRY